MIKRVISISAIAIFLLYSVKQEAQTFTGGLTAGVSTGSVKLSELNSAVTNTVNGKNIMGFEGGIFERMNIDPLFVKGMLMVAYRGGTADFTEKDGSINSSKFTVGKVELPVLLGIRILGPVRVEGGPVFNWVYYEKYNTDNSIKVRQMGVGYRVGANVEVAFLNLGLAYQGITNKSNSSSTSTFEAPNELIFTLGVLLGGTKK